MQIARIGRVIKTGNSLSVVLPVEITRALEIKRGDLVTYGVLTAGEIIIRKLGDDEVKSLNPTTTIIKI